MKAKFIQKDGKTVPDRDESGKSKEVAPVAAAKEIVEPEAEITESAPLGFGKPTMTFTPASHVAGISDKKSFNQWLTSKMFAWNRREANVLQDG